VRGKRQMLCHLLGDDPWTHNILRPIVEAAGYRVVSDDEAADADLVIASKGADVSDAAGKTIWLRADPEGDGKKDESIYRYDRAGLLMALKSASGGRG